MEDEKQELLKIIEELQKMRNKTEIAAAPIKKVADEKKYAFRNMKIRQLKLIPKKK